MSAPLEIAPDIDAALAAGGPVVALETTILTHGMPWPRNLETALAVEAEVRAAGALPATIAISGGRIRIGLSREELEALAQAEGVWKLSRADLAPCLAAGATGSTTVAATLICAGLAGIETFATGGIGGVHRGAAESFDISADLDELARTSLTTVCAGPKAILDIPKTLEALETRGAPAIAYRADEIPAFWSRRSGLAAPLRMESAGEIAAAHVMRRRLGLAGGQLICNPIPEAAEIPPDEIAGAIETALAQGTARGVTGKAVTPMLLDATLKATGGRSLDANVALIRSNARLAGEIAVEIAALRAAGESPRAP